MLGLALGFRWLGSGLNSLAAYERVLHELYQV